jgi:hypothetical protein
MENADEKSLPPRLPDGFKDALDRAIERFRQSDLTQTVNYSGLLELEIMRDMVDAVERGKPLHGLRRELVRVLAPLASGVRPEFLSALLEPSPAPRGRNHEEGLEAALNAFVSGKKPREVAQCYRGKRDVNENDIAAARKAIARLFKKAQKELDEKR